MITKPKFETRPEQAYIGVRTQVPMHDLSEVIPRLFDEGHDWLKAQGVAPAGAPFIRYHVIDMPGQLDVAMGWPVASALAGNGHITAGILPAGRYASVLYTGPYDGLLEANRVLIDWAKDEGLVWDSWDTDKGEAFGSRLEVYLTDPGDEPDPTKWETEVAIRLADK